MNSTIKIKKVQKQIDSTSFDPIHTSDMGMRISY